MSCVHFKFKSSLDYEKVTFQGLHISLEDLRNAIMKQKKIGLSNEFTLEIVDAQTKKVYGDDTEMIPRNTSVVVSRVPLTNAPKLPKIQHRDPTVSIIQPAEPSQTSKMSSDQLKKTGDLANANATEEEKVLAMMSQSGEGFEPSQYAKFSLRGSGGGGGGGSGGVGGAVLPGLMRPPPPNYICYRCGQKGHWIKLCPTNGDPTFDSYRFKRSLGIPSTQIASVSPNVPGAMLDRFGNYVVRTVDYNAQKEGKLKAMDAAAPPREVEVPEELICKLCKELFKDAVVIPCCGDSFCDECIRTHLLENGFVCSICHQSDVSPDTLVPNKKLRAAVKSFQNRLAEEKSVAVARGLPAQFSKYSVSQPMAQLPSQTSLQATLLGTKAPPPPPPVATPAPPVATPSTSTSTLEVTREDAGSKQPVAGGMEVEAVCVETGSAREGGAVVVATGTAPTCSDDGAHHLVPGVTSIRGGSSESVPSAASHTPSPPVTPPTPASLPAVQPKEEPATQNFAVLPPGPPGPSVSSGPTDPSSSSSVPSGTEDTPSTGKPLEMTDATKHVLPEKELSAMEKTSLSVPSVEKISRGDSRSPSPATVGFSKPKIHLSNLTTSCASAITLPPSVLSASLMGSLPIPVPSVLPAQLVALSGLAVPLSVLPGLPVIVPPPPLVPPPSLLPSDLTGGAVRDKYAADLIMGGAMGGARHVGKASPPPLSAEQFYRQQKLLQKFKLGQDGSHTRRRRYSRSPSSSYSSSNYSGSRSRSRSPSQRPSSKSSRGRRHEEERQSSKRGRQDSPDHHRSSKRSHTSRHREETSKGTPPRTSPSSKRLSPDPITGTLDATSPRPVVEGSVEDKTACEVPLAQQATPLQSTSLESTPASSEGATEDIGAKKRVAAENGGGMGGLPSPGGSTLPPGPVAGTGRGGSTQEDAAKPGDKEVSKDGASTTQEVANSPRLKWDDNKACCQAQEDSGYRDLVRPKGQSNSSKLREGSDSSRDHGSRRSKQDRDTSRPKDVADTRGETGRKRARNGEGTKEVTKAKREHTKEGGGGGATRHEDVGVGIDDHRSVRESMRVSEKEDHVRSKGDGRPQTKNDREGGNQFRETAASRVGDEDAKEKRGRKGDPELPLSKGVVAKSKREVVGTDDIDVVTKRSRVVAVASEPRKSKNTHGVEVKDEVSESKKKRSVVVLVGDARGAEPKDSSGTRGTKVKHTSKSGDSAASNNSKDLQGHHCRHRSRQEGKLPDVASALDRCEERKRTVELVPYGDSPTTEVEQPGDHIITITGSGTELVARRPSEDDAIELHVTGTIDADLSEPYPVSLLKDSQKLSSLFVHPSDKAHTHKRKHKEKRKKKHKKSSSKGEQSRHR